MNDDALVEIKPRLSILVPEDITPTPGRVPDHAEQKKYPEDEFYVRLLDESTLNLL
jgi:hypothetical protein